MAARKEEERLRSICYICNGLKFPFGAYLQFLTKEMVQHVVDNHLPLKCDKCSKMFEAADDFKDVEKCCPPEKLPEDAIEDLEKENVDSNQQQDGHIFSSMPVNDQECDEDFDKVLTPLSKINMRWRRKSKEFIKFDGQVMTEEEKRRQTSTPMIGNMLTTKHFTDSSSIHLSSINYTSSTSSESGEFSPSLQANSAAVAPKTPPSIQKMKSVNRSRGKLLVQATPLQQVMSKSIQRAYQQHGDYRKPPFTIQKRRVSFNSTSSSNEGSLAKFIGSGESPIDLRLTPALRRFASFPTTNEVKIPGQLVTADESKQLIDLHSHVEFEQIEVIISRGKISDTTTMSSYKSCCSVGRSGSLPEIDFTPKVASNNLLKKTISFEPPNTIEKTPAFLMPCCSNETQQYENIDDDEDDDDVFYTPRSTPLKPRFIIPSNNELMTMDKFEAFGPVEKYEKPESSQERSSQSSNIWDFVTNVIKIAARKGEGISESLSNSDKLWNFKTDLVKKAADYFTKAPAAPDYSEEPPQKRRRESSSADSMIDPQSPPAFKRQKIQPRKPLERMRKLS